MYGIDQLPNMNFLLGQVLVQIAVGEFQTQFRFADGIVISVNVPVRMVGYPDAALQMIPRRDDSLRQISEALGKSITSVSKADTCLRIGFDASFEVWLFDVGRDYESFSIQNGAQLFVV